MEIQVLECMDNKADHETHKLQSKSPILFDCSDIPVVTILQRNRNKVPDILSISDLDAETSIELQSLEQRLRSGFYSSLQDLLLL
jgi:hypothetical protein